MNPPGDSRRARVSIDQILQRRRHTMPGDAAVLRTLGRVAGVHQDRQSLSNVVRLARLHGLSWHTIGEVLGISADDAREEYGVVDTAIAVASVGEPTSPIVIEKEPEVTVDIREVRLLSDEELIEKAATLTRKMGRGETDQYAGRMREAIVVVLYEREYSNVHVAKLLNLSTQRIQQIVSGYYKRMERVWEQERRERMGV